MSYISSSLTFHSDKITTKMEEFGDEEIIIMMDWEHPAMSASAAYVTEGGGDILEIGFGMGISAGWGCQVYFPYQWSKNGGLQIYYCFWS